VVGAPKPRPFSTRQLSRWSSGSICWLVETKTIPLQPMYSIRLNKAVFEIRRTTDVLAQRPDDRPVRSLLYLSDRCDASHGPQARPGNPKRTRTKRIDDARRDPPPRRTGPRTSGCSVIRRQILGHVRRQERLVWLGKPLEHNHRASTGRNAKP